VAAFFGAALAFGGALLAVIHVVFATFCRAGVADVGTKGANLLGEFGVAAHEDGGGPTDGGALAIEANAIDHVGHIAFTEAGVGTVFTNLGTDHAGVDAVLIDIVSHNEASRCIEGKDCRGRKGGAFGMPTPGGRRMDPTLETFGIVDLHEIGI
jgi:hypothetical protein